MREQDNSDAQYASFRENIPYLLLLLVLHPLLRRVYEAYLCRSDANRDGYQNTTAAAGDARMEQRIRFDYFFALVFITALHGFSAIKVLAILYVNYKIARCLSRAQIPAATWIFNIFTLFANELCGGYPLERFARLLVGSGVAGGSEPALVACAQSFDGFGGLMPRWEILFNITVLRLISFNMDYYWSLDYPSTSPVEVGPFGFQGFLIICLTDIRRSSSIRQPSPSETVSTSPRTPPHSMPATTWHTPSTRHYT